MSTDHSPRIAADLALDLQQVRSVARLLQEGATIPFIARYRKEATGSLDETKIAEIRDRIERWDLLDRRKLTILSTLTDHQILTRELKEKIDRAETLTELEDLYLPYRPKRKTRASAAKERGLEPLATLILINRIPDPDHAALRFIDPDKGVPDTDSALAGARDIMAEWINEDSQVRSALRAIFSRHALLISRVKKNKEESGNKFRDWFDWREPLTKAPSHRILALLRGESEGILSLSARPDEEFCRNELERLLKPGNGGSAEQIRLTADDALKRLLAPALETEMLASARERAERDALAVYQVNLQNLLMSPPLGAQRVLGVDPGFRTGCKLVCLDPQGKLLWHGVMYPLEPQMKAKEAEALIRELCEQYRINAIAIGNGTGGREAMDFIRGLKLPGHMIITTVNESGASVYSASETARREFPKEDITVRGAVSIGRRLLDPLSELVKIDPKAIGVGQYQHDVNQKGLQSALEDVVIRCVNAVGVDLNTASAEILQYISGLNVKTAAAVISYRDTHGAFKSRDELRRVPGLGPKAWEQAAGFLRIRGGRQPLDGSAVHPESYPLVVQMAEDLSCRIDELLEKPSLRKQIDANRYVNEKAGLPTIRDILSELEKPGRDPRDEFQIPDFNDQIRSPEDLKAGMSLSGVVTNVTAFGAFVDVGVHQDGLVHISQLSDTYVKNIQEVVHVGQNVMVRVLEVDLARKRISLSMKS